MFKEGDKLFCFTKDLDKCRLKNPWHAIKALNPGKTYTVSSMYRDSYYTVYKIDITKKYTYLSVKEVEFGDNSYFDFRFKKVFDYPFEICENNLKGI